MGRANPIRTRYIESLLNCFSDTGAMSMSFASRLVWQYFWAVAFVGGFSGGGGILVDCISKQTTSAAVHPAVATWQCEL